MGTGIKRTLTQKGLAWLVYVGTVVGLSCLLSVVFGVDPVMLLVGAILGCLAYHITFDHEQRPF